MTPSAVLHLKDPCVGVEAQFPREAFLDLSLRSGFFAEASAEQPVRWTRIVENALGRGAEQLRRPVQSIEFDENGAGLLRAASPHGGEGAFAVAAADIGGDPDCRFQAHSRFSLVMLRAKYSPH